MRLIFQTHFFICYNKINDVNYKENISLENGMNFIEDNIDNFISREEMECEECLTAA
jgi:hypothetical protein